MVKSVRMYGTAPNLQSAPPLSEGVEVWLCNSIRAYQRRLPRVMQEWTRWFNLHSKAHQLLTYPETYHWYGKQLPPKKLYFQRDNHPTIACAEVFPRQAIQERFPEAGNFYTCSIAWLLAFAIFEGFDRIELCGFELRSSKPLYLIERPCFFYWIQKARDAGIEVIYPDEIAALPFEVGDPLAYSGPIYGFETKPEAEAA